jgi:type I restriction enzyme M protein
MTLYTRYTSIPTNILFFDRSGPTRAVWFYEQPLPEGRKQYTKTQPIQFEEFAGCLAWWGNRAETERAWKAPAAAILANGCNLDIKNPSAAQDLEHLPPDQLVLDIIEKEQRIAAIMIEIKQILSEAVRRDGTYS